LCTQNSKKNWIQFCRQCSVNPYLLSTHRRPFQTFLDHNFETNNACTTPNACSTPNFRECFLSSIMHNRLCIILLKNLVGDPDEWKRLFFPFVNASKVSHFLITFD
jgi:hypothetical protein